MDLTKAREGEIRLTLISKAPIHDGVPSQSTSSSAADTLADPKAADKVLWVRTKAFVLAHIKVQPGPDLLISLSDDATREDEDTWAYVAQGEIEAIRKADQRHGIRSSPKLSGGKSLDDELYTCVRRPRC